MFIRETNIATSSHLLDRLLLRGIHLPLTDAMKAIISKKVERLIRHEPSLVRVRIDISKDHSRPPLFAAKGRLEVAGPDLAATVTTENAYKSVGLLIDKLDRMLRKRTSALNKDRASEDIRTYRQMKGDSGYRVTAPTTQPSSLMAHEVTG
jgi:putative sigma-54 modulation protein